VTFCCVQSSHLSKNQQESTAIRLETNENPKSKNAVFQEREKEREREGWGSGEKENEILVYLSYDESGFTLILSRLNSRNTLNFSYIRDEHYREALFFYMVPHSVNILVYSNTHTHTHTHIYIYIYEI